MRTYHTYRNGKKSEGSGLIQKVWRYNDQIVNQYSRDRVEQELTELFQSRGFRLELSYKDSLVGNITIDGDRDMQAALKAFSEEESLSFRTITVKECIKPEIEFLKEKEHAPPAKKRKVIYTDIWFHDILLSLSLCRLFKQML